jgi:hypothetical protein
MSKKSEIISDETKQSFEDAVMTPEEIEQEIAAYERKNGFGSEKLLEMQAEGTLADSYDIQDWLTLLELRKK